ncbi:MAG: hypothetical protein V1862_09285 [Methanobacteriota archaeon]
MVFDCQICGTCCMYLGDYIVIEEQTGPYTFNCCCVSTGTDFSAEVDPDKRVFFDDHTFPDLNRAACRFLRPLGEGRIGCTIHTDSPFQCKYYRCVVMHIETSSGEQIGYITGTLSLHSEDIGLRRVWDDLTRALNPSEPEGEVQIRAFLEQAGYRIT